MASQQLLAALGESVIGAELKGDLAKAESSAMRFAEGDRGTSRRTAALDVAIVQMLKGDLRAAEAALAQSKRLGGENAGEELRALTYEDLWAQLQFNFFPSGIGANSIEIASRRDAVAHAEGLGEWDVLFERVRGTADAVEPLILHRLPGILLSVRAIASRLRRSGGDTQAVVGGTVPALLSIGAATPGVPPSCAAYARRAAATVCRDAGERGDAESLLESAREAYSDAKDPVGIATCLMTRGDWMAAPFSSPLLLDFAVVESGSEGSDLDWEVEALEARWDEADLAGAQSAYSDAEKMLAGVVAPRAHAALELRRSYLSAVGGDFEAAVGLAAAAAHRFEESGDGFGHHLAAAHTAHARVGSGELPQDTATVRAIGDWGQAAGSFSYALGIGLILGRAGRHWLVRRGDYERALACYRLARALYEALGADLNAIQSVVDQAKVHKALGDSRTASFFIQQALREISAALTSRPELERDLRRREQLIGDNWGKVDH